jgi:myo-inositol-1(or 4)-monophosphatase
VATRVATEAAELLAGAVDDERRLVQTKSSSTDMVTEMDRASEVLLVDRICELRPDDGIVGEEGADRAGSTGVVWVIDPLDGTTNYLYRHPGWNVSVGATVDGVPAVGAVAIPTLGEVFGAATGLGATRGGRPLRLGPPAPLHTSLVGTGFGYDRAVRRAQAEVLTRVIGEVRDIRRGGAAAADLCSVAAGRLDAYYENGLADWDRVAGTVVAREAGARVEVLPAVPGAAVPGDCTVAAHPERFDDLVALLAAAGLLG